MKDKFLYELTYTRRDGVATASFLCTTTEIASEIARVLLNPSLETVTSVTIARRERFAWENTGEQETR